MRQLLQSLDTGETNLIEAPVPSAAGPTVVVRVGASVLSAGTERMLVDFGRSNLISKARQQPAKVRQVVDKIRTDGFRSTIEAVRSKLGTPIPMGYCSAGEVVEVGDGRSPFRVGDMVATNGPHAEYVRVPYTLAAKIPQGVSLESAAFTPVAAIGLEGVRLAQPTLGETVVVYGLGLIGLLTVQLLKANGCQVIGIDRSEERLALASSLGARAVPAEGGDVVAAVRAATGGMGADAVLLTLSSSSQQPIRHAAAMSRTRGRLVLVGVTGLELDRDEFYRKELAFQVSCSYGPGRYDPNYEEGARDYPIGHVRWTEQRNFAAVLQLMADGTLDPRPLVSHRFEFDRAAAAYDLLTGESSSLGVVFTYPDAPDPSGSVQRIIERRPAIVEAPSLGVVGAGNFAVRTLLPITKELGIRHRVVAASSGTPGAIAGEKFDFERVVSSAEDVMADPAVTAVAIVTRHDSHAELAVKALEAGKHVFVEKPLALTVEQLEAVGSAAEASSGTLMVGFNRRFAPLARSAFGHLAGRSGPAALSMVVNAGAIPGDHWTQDPQVGGGRIVGEACHFIDLARYLIGAPIIALEACAARSPDGKPVTDIASMALRFADGSIATIQYLANGPTSYPKERIECFFDGRVVAIDNWRKLRGWGPGAPRRAEGGRQDKGHRRELEAWWQAVREGGPSPIPLEELLEVSRWAIHASAQVNV